MKTRAVPLLLLLLGLPAGLACTAAGPARIPVALAEPFFSGASVEARPENDGGHDLVLERTMPTPGWTFAFDVAAEPDEAGRLAVRITATAPEGAVIQVMTPTTIRVPLPPLPEGRTLADVAWRRATDPGFTRVQAFVLVGGAG